MFDIRKVADEVFSTLRSFNYEVAMFDAEGNRVYEPEVATRFFTNAKNITISLDEDGENSTLKVLLGHSVDLASVQGMLDTMRATATKFGILFNTRKYNRELAPKDFASGSAVLEGRSLSGSTKSSYLKLEGARMIIRHDTSVDENKHGARARNIKKIMVENTEGERFLMPSCNLGAGRAMTRHVSKGGHWSDDKGQKLAEMAKQQRDLRDCARYCRKNSRKLDEDVSGLIETCVDKARSYRDVFEGIYKNYDKNISSLPETNDMVLNEDDEDFNTRVDALCEKLKLEEDSVINRKTCETVARVIEGTTLEEKKLDLIALPALDLEVERAAWDQFKDSNTLNLRGPVDLSAAHGGDNALPAKLRIISNNVTDDGMANLIATVAQRLSDGDQSALLKHIARIAVAAVTNITEEEEEEGGEDDAPELDEANDMIELPKFGCKVETEAWNDLKAGKIKLRNPVEFPEMGHSANDTVIKLQEIAKQVTFSGLANMLSRVADDIDMGRNTSLHQAVANCAIAAATTSSENRDDGRGFSKSLQEGAVIQTKAIREFGQWFDNFSTSKIFESSGFSGSYDDQYADEVDQGIDAAAENFSVDDFLVMAGDDFGYGHDDAAETQVSAPQLLSSLASYLSDEASSHMDDSMTGTGTELGTKETARKLLPEVIEKLEGEGYTVTEKEALEDGDLDGLDIGSDVVGMEDVLDEADTEGKFIVVATSPSGEELYCPSHGEPTADKSKAIVYTNARAAHGACTRWYGTNTDAFWGSEIAARNSQAKKFRGWKFSAQPLTGDEILLSGEELAAEDVLLPNNPASDLKRDVAPRDGKEHGGGKDSEDINRLLTLSGMRNYR